MRILQLTHDWKWTGPAEPMLRLAVALRERGHESLVACPEPESEDRRGVAGEARAMGVAPAHRLERAKGVRPFRDRGEVARLRTFLETADIDLVHSWHTRDHVLALRASGARRRAGRTRLVRSYRNGDRIARTPWNRWLFGPGCDGLLCVSPEVARWNQPLRGGRPSLGQFGAVDTVRFSPRAPAAEVRSALGLERGQRVVGIVARVQSHRRFDLLLEAARRLFERDPAARLLIVGRGTRREELAVEPARALGIADRVVFAGYRGEDYDDVLRCMDVFTYLVPGSDGTCRALLEAMACGIPAVTSRRGALPEIGVDGETGLLVDEEPEALAAAWSRLLDDPDLRARTGALARKRAETTFTPERFAEAALALYDAVRS